MQIAGAREGLGERDGAGRLHVAAPLGGADGRAGPPGRGARRRQHRARHHRHLQLLRARAQLPLHGEAG